MSRYPFYAAVFTVVMILAFCRPAAGQQVNETIASIQKAFEDKKIDRSSKILYQLYAGIAPSKVPPEYRSATDRNKPIKCATPYIQEYLQYQNQLTGVSVTQIDRIISTSQAQQQSYSSASGRFTIFYETSGAHAVPSTDANSNSIPDYVEWAAAAADSSWRHEVQTLGYTNPIRGSTDPYPIYIEDLGANGTYGFTSTGSNRGYGNSTYIVINSQLDQPIFTNNDHPDPTQGAVNVTVAHELKHAIQYANSQWYAITNGPNSPHNVEWSEMDAVYMEEVVYDNVNDYYNYLTGDGSIFDNDEHTIPVSYSGATWFIYFDEYYEPDFWVKVWERIKQRYDDEQLTRNPNYLSMPEAISMVLAEDYDDSFKQNFIRSHLWHFASGSLSGMGYGFSERENYPTPSINFDLSGRDRISMEQNIIPLSANYIEVDASVSLPGFLLITLANTTPATSVGVLAYYNDGRIESEIYNAENSNWSEIKTNWEWDQVRRFGIIFANSTPADSASYEVYIDSNIPEEITLSTNFPNPFRQQTTIPLSIPEDAHVQVKVFDITGRLVETLLDEDREAGRNPITFDGAGLASGIYLVQVIVDGEAFVQKMTLIK